MTSQGSDYVSKILRSFSSKKGRKQFGIASGVAGVLRTSLVIAPDAATSNNPDTSSRNKSWVSNAALVLDIVKDIGEILEKVPYVKMGAGIAVKAVKVKEEIDACRDEWKKAKSYLAGISDMMDQFRDSTVPLSKQVEDGFRELESCLSRVLDARKQYQDEGMMMKILERGTLKTEATLCVEKIVWACMLFQAKMGIQTFVSIQKLSGAIPPPPPSLPMRLDEVLKCPPPSQYFVGRQMMLHKLSKIFAVPIVIVFNKNQDVLTEFVKYRLKQWVNHLMEIHIIT
ncbi:hypothetical protein VKT23_002738 [Stygiomarasmius scandens]|uniref:Uncharacterized protein n=1 Tax=Marasmiellus scandens TaxID=2682957 RepID=A0ABR1K3A3_9AGAR